MTSKKNGVCQAPQIRPGERGVLFYSYTGDFLLKIHGSLKEFTA